MYAEVAPQPGQPVSANFEVNKNNNTGISYCIIAIFLFYYFYKTRITICDFLFEVSWNVAKRICVSEGIKAANIPRNGFNGTTARLAEVNSQHKNDQLKANTELGKSHTK